MDGFGRIVQVRKKTIQDIIIWLHDIIQYDDDFNEDNGKNVIYQLFQFISDIINSNTGNLLIHFVYNNEVELHLPIPVYSYIRPDMRTQFIGNFPNSMSLVDGWITTAGQCHSNYKNAISSTYFTNEI